MPTPTLSTPEFLVNTSVAGLQSDGTLLALADGRFMVAWCDRDGQDGNIYARVFNADGTPSGNGQSFQIGNSLGKQVDPALAQLADGRVVLVWTDETSLSLEYSIATFDSSGNPVFSAETSFAINGGWHREPTVVAVGNGFVVTCKAQDIGDEVDIPSIGFFPQNSPPNSFSPGGFGYFPASNLQHQFNPSSVKLTDGRTLFTWADQSEIGAAPFAGDTIRGRIISADGSITYDEFIVNAYSNPSGITNVNALEPTAVAMAGGGYAVFWSINTVGGDGGDIRGRIYTASGVSTADFSVASPSGVQFRPTAAGLDDGTVVVAWVDTTAGASGNYAVKARVFNADGTPASDEFTVTTKAIDNTSATGATVEIASIEKLLDGRFVITWNDNSGTLGDTDQAIHAAIYDPRTAAVEWTGTTAGEQFVGTIYGDNLVGGGGNDSINGGDGNDAIRGDAGNDTIVGGDGIDRISYWASSGVTLTLAEGGSGTFTFSGADAGLGTDTYSGIEGIDGSEFNPDNLTGNSSDNILYGFGGNDTLNGGAGADTLDGGAGADTLDGGAGADQLNGGADNDVLIGGAGADQLNGSDGFDFVSYYTATFGVSVDLLYPILNSGDAIGDTFTSIEAIVGSNFADGLFGTETADVMYGAAGDDVMYGRAGDDVLLGTSGNDTMAGGQGDDTYYGTDYVSLDNDQLLIEGTTFGKDLFQGFGSNPGANHDVIRFLNGPFADFADVFANSHQFGTDVVITKDWTNWIVLVAVNKNELSADDFLFG
jgi:Ca2+-binding RTX toxin-like protein